MKMLVCAVKDSKAAAFQNLLCMSTRELAKRALGEAVVAGGDRNTIAKYPYDHSIWCLAEYDDQTGMIVPLPMPEFIANASDFIKAKEGSQVDLVEG